MRFASIVGARPQFIKLAPVSRALRQGHDEIIIHTGQHYDERLSATFFDELEIPAPDYHLEVGSMPHGAQTGRMLEAIEQVLIREKPDGVIVFGDTNSTLAGALAAAKLHIPVVHVEAGLRSFNRQMPEEINRVLTDHVSARLFCPTETAREHLSREGITHGVEVVGDVMYDVLLRLQPRLASQADEKLSELGAPAGEFLLLTIHRPVNTDDREAMRRIARALTDTEMPVIFPVHPRTRHLLSQYDIEWGHRIQLVEPLGYLDMLTLQQFARHIVTDSGGVQKEAYLLGIPCVTLRDETEWPETLMSGWNVLTGSNYEALLHALQAPIPQPSGAHPFGNGDAAERIARSLSVWP